MDQDIEHPRSGEMTEPAAGSILGEGIYEQLRREILAGILRPNQALVEAEIAERLVVSRMPVRESLHRLAGEGLVRSQRRRWIVHEHTAEEVRDIYEVRAALEAEAAALASSRATAAELTAIGAAGVPELFSRAPNRDARMDANERFHSLIIAASHNRRLPEMLHRNVTYFNFRLSLFSTPQELEESGIQHQDISNAIAARNAACAWKAAYSHVYHSLEIIERRLL